MSDTKNTTAYSHSVYKMFHVEEEHTVQKVDFLEISNFWTRKSIKIDPKIGFFDMLMFSGT